MNTQYLQLAIDGIAENKDFNDALGIPTREIKRVKLAEFIRYKLLKRTSAALPASRA